MGKQSRKKKEIEYPMSAEKDSNQQAASDSEDDAPESVSFAEGRENATEETRRQAKSRKLYEKRRIDQVLKWI